MKKCIVWFLLLALVVPCSLARAGTQYFSITELQEAAPDRWIQTYESHGRTISIDVAAQLPTVTAFPVITVRKPADKTPETALADFTQVFGNEPGHIGGRIGKDFSSIAGLGNVRQQVDIYRDGETPTTLPEDNPVDYAHALEAVTERIGELTGLRYEEGLFAG